MQPGGTAAAVPVEKVFDVGIDERLSVVFPGILGRSFNLPPEQIAYLYGMTFLVCGFVAMLLRLPIIRGP